MVTKQKRLSYLDMQFYDALLHSACGHQLWHWPPSQAGIVEVEKIKVWVIIGIIYIDGSSKTYHLSRGAPARSRILLLAISDEA
jgi:hypothetical protein